MDSRILLQSGSDKIKTITVQQAFLYLTKPSPDEHDTHLAKQFLKEEIDLSNLDATLILADLLIKKNKLNKAFHLVNNALKVHYKDPTLWSLLSYLY